MAREYLRVLLYSLLALVAAASHQLVIHGVTCPAWAPTVFNGALIGIGVVEVFLGYRLFKVTLFVLGFLGAGLVLFFVTLDGTHVLGAAIGVAAVGALLVGGAGAWFPKIGVFLVGGTLGLVAGECLRLTVLVHLPTKIALGVFITTCVLLGVGFGILGIYLMRITVIASTSIVGSFAMFRGISMLLIPLGVTMLPTTTQEVKNGITDAAPVWGSVAGIAVLSIIGIVVQLKWTAKKKDADEKDHWEQVVADSEISLAAVVGGSADGSKASGRGKKKAKASKSKKAKSRSINADALLHDQEVGGEFYEDAGGGGDVGGYYDAEDDGSGGYYAAAQDEWAPPPQQQQPAKASWWGSKKKKAPAAAAEVEW